MLPTKLILDLVSELTDRTRKKKIQWQRERQDQEREHYTGSIDGVTGITVRYHPSRAAEDTIEMAVLSTNIPIGQITRQEGQEGYDVLASLLFAIQISENRNNFQGAANKILEILPAEQRKTWEGQK